MAEDSARRGRTIRVSETAHAALSQLAITLTGPAGRRVTLSAALVAACRMAAADPARAVAELPGEDGGET